MTLHLHELRTYAVINGELYIRLDPVGGEEPSVDGQADQPQGGGGGRAETRSFGDDGHQRHPPHAEGQGPQVQAL